MYLLMLSDRKEVNRTVKFQHRVPKFPGVKNEYGGNYLLIKHHVL